MHKNKNGMPELIVALGYYLMSSSEILETPSSGSTAQNTI